jgi:hypothetical protein
MLAHSVVFRGLGLSHSHHLISTTTAENTNSLLNHLHVTSFLGHARCWIITSRRLQLANTRRPASFLAHTRPRFSTPHRISLSQRTMASIAGEKHKWNAVHVRETFLDYFKKNGHTFGR